MLELYPYIMCDLSLGHYERVSSQGMSLTGYASCAATIEDELEGDSADGLLVLIYIGVVGGYGVPR